MINKCIAAALSLLIGTQTIQAQPEKNWTAYFRTRDSILFNAVLNTCDLRQIENTFAASFGYTQDQGDDKPPHSTNRAEFIGNIARRCTATTTKLRIRRQLVTDSDSASLITAGFAAQNGVQRFYLSADGQPEQLIEESHFTRIWQRENQDWKLEREMDYQIRTHDPQSTAGNNLLYQQITTADSALFAAYNHRDIAGLKKWFDPGLEFYHDKGGLTHYADNMENFERHFQDTANSTRRELVQGSLQIYPLNDYGAVEMGTHRFYTLANGKQQLTATADFINIWHTGNGSWKLTRVISYDHR